MKKKCNTCFIVKGIGEFRRYRNRCKSCNSKIDIHKLQLRRQNDPTLTGKLTAKHKTYVGTDRGYSSTRITIIKRRAFKKGLDFDLDVSWVEERLDKCELTGIKFDYIDWNKLPSVDRIDPTKGYIKSNCRLILNCVNAFKGTMTDDECRKIAKALLDGSEL